MSCATRPLLPLAAVTAGLASGSALAAEWTFTPWSDFSTQTQQNPGLSSDENHKNDVSNGFAGTAGLGVVRKTEHLSLNLAPVIRAYRYADNASLDRDEEQLNFSFDWLGEKISWRAGANAARDTTLTSELGTTGLTQGNQRHETWSVSAGPSWSLTERWQLASNVGTSANRYPDEHDSLSNYSYSTALLSTTYVLNEKVVVSLYGTAGRLDSEGNGANTDDRSANVEVRYTLSPLSSVGASIGRSWVTSDAGRTQGLLYSVNASRVFEKGLLAFSMSRRQSPSGRALLTEADEARLSFVTQFTERLSATVGASYSKRRNVLQVFDVDLERVRYTRADVSLSWRMAPNWSLGFGGSYAIQQVGSAFLNDDLTGRGSEVRLGLSWNGDPYVR
ncbi:MAG: transporter [Gammaproteobacteria bacterium]